MGWGVPDLAVDLLSQSAKRVAPMPGVAAGDQGALIADFQAVVRRVDIGLDVPRVAGCAQEAPDELVQPEPFGTGQLDGAVDRRALGDIGQGRGNVIGRFGLEVAGAAAERSRRGCWNRRCDR